MSSGSPSLAPPPRSFVPILFLLVTVKGILFAVLVPLGQGPDEPAHVIHVLLYARQAELQVVGRDDPGIRPDLLWSHMFWPSGLAEDSETLENTFAILQAGRFWELVEAARPHPSSAREMMRTDLVQYVAPRRYTTPLYFFGAAMPLRWVGVHGIVEQWMLLRMLSVALGLGVLGFTYATARLVWPSGGEWPAVAATALLAFLPQFSFLSSVVSPDILVAFLSSAALYTACRVASAPGSPTRMAVLVAIGFLAAAVKEQGVLVLVFSVAAIPLLLWWDRGRTPWLVGRTALALVTLAGLSVATFLVLGNTAAVERAAALATERARDLADALLVSPLVYLRFFLILFVSSWFSYGWAIYKMSLGWYIVFAALAAAGAAGVVRVLLARRPDAAVERRGVILALLLIGICLLAVLVVLGPGHDGVQGRHVLAAFPAAAILMTLGVSEVAPGRREGVFRSFAALMLFLNLVIVTKYLIPLFYLGAA